MDTHVSKTFRVSVKGLFFDKAGKMLMVQEPDGTWELPGGKVHKGEDLVEGLKRECREETGLACRVLDRHPSIAYSTLDKKGRGRIMLFYKIQLPSLDFTPSNECVDMKYFRKDEIRKLKTVPQLRKLPDYL